MIKFERILASNESAVKGTRRTMVLTDVKRAQEKLQQELEDKMRDIDRSLLGLTDLYPDSTLSLMVVKPDFDANKWVSEIHNLRVKKALLQVEMKIATETFDEWFTDEPETTSAE